MKFILHAAVAVTLIGISAAFEVNPISEETAAEYKLDRNFFSKGTLAMSSGTSSMARASTTSSSANGP